jgi:hypothetical protein
MENLKELEEKLFYGWPHRHFPPLKLSGNTNKIWAVSINPQREA